MNGSSLDLDKTATPGELSKNLLPDLSESTLNLILNEKQDPHQPNVQLPTAPAVADQIGLVPMRVLKTEPHDNLLELSYSADVSDSSHESDAKKDRDDTLDEVIVISSDGNYYFILFCSVYSYLFWVLN